eukprot:GEMP01009961.1.p1 GENE.GEMP01009961.1~~GEMP01009961.1.p1  ORF type:complete len:989 (+),score=193.87 GEMP01009961.1:95-3061(+)
MIKGLDSGRLPSVSMTELASSRALDGARHMADSGCAWLVRIKASTPVPALQVIKRGITALKVPQGRCIIRHGTETILSTENILPGTVRCNGSDVHHRSVGLRHGDEIQVADTKLTFLADLDTSAVQTDPGAEKKPTTTYNSGELPYEPSLLENEVDQLRRDRERRSKVTSGSLSKRIVLPKSAPTSIPRQVNASVGSAGSDADTQSPISPRSILRRSTQDKHAVSFPASSVRFDPASRRSGQTARASGQTARSSGRVARPSGQTARPSGQAAHRSDQAARPSGQAARPSGLAARPSGQAERPSGQAARSSGQAAARPSGQAARPSGQVARPSGQIRTNKSPTPPSSSTVRQNVPAIGKSKSPLARRSKDKSQASTPQSGKMFTESSDPASETTERASPSGQGEELSRVNPSVAQYRFGAHILHLDHLLDASRPSTTALDHKRATQSTLPQNADNTVDGRPVNYGRQSKHHENAEAIQKLLGRLVPRRMIPQVDDVDSENLRVSSSSDEDKIPASRWTTQEVDEEDDKGEFMTSVAIDEHGDRGAVRSSTDHHGFNKQTPSSGDDGINATSPITPVPIGISNPTPTAPSNLLASYPSQSPLSEPSDVALSYAAAQTVIPQHFISRSGVATLGTSLIDTSLPASALDNFGDAAAAHGTTARYGALNDATASANTAQHGDISDTDAADAPYASTRHGDLFDVAIAYRATRHDAVGDAVATYGTTPDDDLGDAAAAFGTTSQQGCLDDAAAASGLTARHDALSDAVATYATTAKHRDPENGAAAHGTTAHHSDVGDAAAAYGTTAKHGDLGDAATAYGITAQRSDLDNASATYRTTAQHGYIGDRAVAYGTTEDNDLGDAAPAYGISAQHGDLGDATLALSTTQHGSLHDTATAYRAKAQHGDIGDSAVDDGSIPDTFEAILSVAERSSALLRARTSATSLPATHIEDLFLEEEQSELAVIKARDQRSNEIIKSISSRSQSSNTLDPKSTKP